MRFIHFEHQDKLGVLSLLREEKRNALNSDLLHELYHFFTTTLPKTAIHILIIKADIAGADIFEMASLNKEELNSFAELGEKVMHTIESCHFITIASVEKYALGGGFELCLSTDFITASPTALFGFPEVTLGLVPGFGGIVRLGKRVNEKNLILNGKKITGKEALEKGLIDELMDAKIFAKTLLKNPFHALLKNKELIRTFHCQETLKKHREAFVNCFLEPETRSKLYV